MKEKDEENLNNEEENESEYTSESQSLASKSSIRSSSLSSISQISMNDKNIINKIGVIIKSYTDKKSIILDENNEEIIQNASNGLCQYISNKNDISLLLIQDSLKNTLINYFCNQQDYFNLKVVLVTLEKQNIDNNSLNAYFLTENNNNMNIFESSSELGDIKIFNIIKKYLMNNDNLLKELIKPNRDNIFHIAARNNQIISLLFYYQFYKNYDCLQVPNETLETPLHICGQKNYYDFANMLVNLGVNVDLKDKRGKTALFYAAEKQSERIIKNLLLNGANKHIKDNNNKKCIDYIDIKNSQNDDKDYEDKNQIVYDILEDKGLCKQLFKCPIIYQSLKENHKHILMIIFVVFLIILQITILIFFLVYKYTKNINNNEYFNNELNNIIEFILILIDLFTEILIIIIFLFFSFQKKQLDFLNNQNINNCKKELYELFFENNNINYKLCARCKKLIEPGTKHCISCDRCIIQWDHHCFWLNTCINSQNKKYFIIFLINSFLSLLINIATSIFIFIEVLNFPQIYNIFLMKDVIENEKKLDNISIIIIIIDCFFILFYFIIITSFILPFVFDCTFDKENYNKNNNSKKITKDISISVKLISSSSV